MNERSESPIERARRLARQERPKRFYKEATVVEENGAFAVLLDGKPVRTPGRNRLALPVKALAEDVAAEWRGQGTHIEPSSMPLTRLVNTIIDRVPAARAEVLDEICGYAGTDLLCYRAGEPEGLVAKQNEHWNPVLAWAEREYGLRLDLTEGVIHVEQDEKALKKYRKAIETDDVFLIGAMSAITTLTGSAVLAFAVRDGHLDADAAWEAAHVDEDWQISLWGEDEEAAQRRLMRKAEMDAAVRIFDRLREG